MTYAEAQFFNGEPVQHPEIAKFWSDPKDGRGLREVMTEPPEFTDAKTWNLDRYRKG